MAALINTCNTCGYKAISHLGLVSPSWCDSLRLVDPTPLPCAASRQTAPCQRSRVPRPFL